MLSAYLQQIVIHVYIIVTVNLAEDLACVNLILKKYENRVSNEKLNESPVRVA
jgi:hypothetical protein